jgi:acetyl esterase/lipase
MPLLRRRDFLAAAAMAPFPGDKPRTYTYKNVAGLNVQADVYAPPGGAGRPILVWIHGGALIMGNRTEVPERFRKLAWSAGYVLVSIDYRLAPETRLPAIIQDVEEAFRWIRAEGARRFGADPARLAVAGGSAGGYLTMLTGYRVQPRPRVLLSLWGYGDLIGSWYSAPSPYPRHHEINMTREESFRQVSGKPISDDRDRKGNGDAFYQYCRRTGTWPQAVSGWDPRAEAAKFYPYMPLRNVTSRYPPTFFIHGTADTDVPYQQSVLMAEQLKKNRVDYRLISIAGGEHGLDGGDPRQIEAAYTEAWNYVRARLDKA